MIIITILMMVLFFRVLGFLFRIGWKIASGILGFIGFLIFAALMFPVIGVLFLPVIGVILLILLLIGSLPRI